MKYLEDTLAEQCLSKTLYPNTKIYVRRKKVEGTLMTYTNELEVEIDFSDVDPSLLDESSETTIESVGASLASDNSNLSDTSNNYDEPKVGLGTDKPKSTGVGVGSKFFKK
jgi:hypothetical protein